MSDASKARTMLAKMFQAYAARMKTQGYMLLVMAIPETPGEIEATYSREMGDDVLFDLLEGFLEQRKKDDPEKTADDFEIAAEAADPDEEAEGLRPVPVTAGQATAGDQGQDARDVRQLFDNCLFSYCPLPSNCKNAGTCQNQRAKSP